MPEICNNIDDDCQANEDGVDEIWFVNNSDPVHPLAISKYRLDRLDALTGKTLGDREWLWEANYIVRISASAPSWPGCNQY